MSQPRQLLSLLTLALTGISLTGCNLQQLKNNPLLLNSDSELIQEARDRNPLRQLSKRELYQIPEDWSEIERQIIEEHSKVRQNPQSYIPLMEAWLEQFEDEYVVRNGIAPRVNLITQEGKAAVREAIEFLRQQEPVGPLAPSEGLAAAAGDHVADQSVTGETGHDGADGSEPQTRMKRYGIPYLSGENIAYGPNTAQQVVMQLIIDDGVPDRGHRVNIFKPEFQVAGVACGEHLTFRTMCVINYAQGYLENENAQIPEISFKVSNQSGVDVTGVYLTSAREADWGENRLRETLANRYIGTFTSSGLILGSEQVCNYNLRAVLATGEEKVARDVNLCSEVYTMNLP